MVGISGAGDLGAIIAHQSGIIDTLPAAVLECMAHAEHAMVGARWSPRTRVSCASEAPCATCTP